ncbi:unnamed protein product, partial [Musa textilis]
RIGGGCQKNLSIWIFGSLLFIEVPYQLNPNESCHVGYWISIQLPKSLKLVGLYPIISY